ncbi:MAG: helix-turn-helix domain-containing protein [Planctomycetaceae bacterium]
MATVQYDHDCRDDFDDDDRRFDNRSFDHPSALADTEHSDVARAECDYTGPGRQSRSATTYHRIAEVRQRQGVTLRNVARRLGMSLPLVRRQEQPDCDLRISELHRWQQVLEVPVSELLEEGDGQLSGPVLERSRMVKLMKTAAAIRERTQGQPVERMVAMLVEQILEIMPELEDVTPWHTVGQRRTLDEVGRTGRMLVPDEIFRRSGGPGGA